MIDISAEHLLAIREVPRMLPVRPNGKRIHISAVYRWLMRGVGGIRLESIRVGGITYTSSEAVQRFAERLSQDRLPVQVPQVPSAARRRRQTEQASQRVAEILGRRMAGKSSRNRLPRSTP